MRPATNYDLMIPAEHSRAIIRRLMESAHMSVREISRGAGLAECLIEDLAYGERRFILSASYDSLRDYYAAVTRERAETGLRWV